MKTAKLVILASLLLCVAACGCGDRFATRGLYLSEGWAYSADTTHFSPIEVDTSQLPPDTHLKRIERKDVCGNPITEIRVYNHPVRVLLVPATQPQQAPKKMPHASQPPPAKSNPSTPASPEPETSPLQHV